MCLSLLQRNVRIYIYMSNIFLTLFCSVRIFVYICIKFFYISSLDALTHTFLLQPKMLLRACFSVLVLTCGLCARHLNMCTVYPCRMSKKQETRNEKRIYILYYYIILFLRTLVRENSNVGNFRRNMPALLGRVSINLYNDTQLNSLWITPPTTTRVRHTQIEST